MWSLIDKNGNDFKNYFSDLLTNDFVITFKQNNKIVQYSGTTGSFTLVNLPKLDLYYIYHDTYNQPLILVLSSDTTYSFNQNVCITFEILTPNIDDAILISPDIEYIQIGNQFYLKYVDPINLINPILTDDNDFISVGENLFLKYVNPTPIPSSTQTPTPTPTFTPTPSPFYYYYNLLDCNNSNNKVGRSITGGLTGIYNVDIDTCYLIVGILFGSSYDYDLDTSTLVVNCDDMLIS